MTEQGRELIRRLVFLSKTEPCRNIGAVHEAAAELERLYADNARKDEEREQVISAWAFAHNIDGATRNDLFRRLAAFNLSEDGTTQNAER